MAASIAATMVPTAQVQTRDLLAGHGSKGLAPVRDALLPAGQGERWVALLTAPRREKRAARLCAYLGLRYYLPLRWCSAAQSRSATQGRNPANVSDRSLVEPLFAGYLFAVLCGETQRDLTGAGTVVKIIPVPAERDFLAELRQIRTALDAQADLVPVAALRRGERVRVFRGPLSGVVGLVVDLRRRRRQRMRLVLNVSLLGRAAAVEVNLDDVRRIAPDPESARGEDSLAAAILA